MSARQDAVLTRLDADFGSDYWPYLRTVAEQLEMSERDVRNAARALARKGYARLERLFDEDTGLTAGSTYIITADGHAALQVAHEEALGEVH